MKKKFFAVFAIVLSFALTAALYGCGEREQQNPTTPKPSSSVQPQTEPQNGTDSANPALQQTQPQQETMPTQQNEETRPQQNEEDTTPANQPDLTGSWDPVSGESIASGAQVNLGEIYGSGYAYGGSLDLNSDGTFFVGVGIINDNDAHKGTYTVTGASIQVSYNNGTSDTFEYISDYNGAEAIKARQGDYYIYFCR